jgi:hypothetical protein
VKRPAGKRKHIPVEHVPELGYPSCAGEPLPRGELIASEHLRSGPAHHKWSSAT